MSVVDAVVVLLLMFVIIVMLLVFNEQLRNKMSAQDEIIHSLRNQLSILDWQYRVAKFRADVYEKALKKHQEGTTNE